MLNILRSFLALSAICILAGCAATDPVAGLATLVDDDAARIGLAAGDGSVVADDNSAAKKLADRLLGEVQGHEDRAVRFCMITAGISELMTFRVTEFDPDYAAAALGHFVVLEAVAHRFDDADEVWFETDLRLALIDLGEVLVDVGKDRVPRLLSAFAGGVNVRGVLDRAGVVAGQAALADAIVADTRRLVQRLNSDGISTQDGLAACQGRLERNRARVGAIAGA